MKNLTLLFVLSIVSLCSSLAMRAQTTPTPPVNTQSSQTNTYKFPDSKTRVKRYVNSIVGVGALAGTIASATIQQINNEPSEWKKTKNGFARRLGSNFGQNLIKQTTLYGLSEAFKQDSEYQKCSCKGILRRVGHALKYGFVSPNRQGKEVFSPAKIVSPFVANIAAVEIWYPKRYSIKDGLRSGTYSFGFSVGFNLIKEFIFK